AVRAPGLTDRLRPRGVRARGARTPPAPRPAGRRLVRRRVRGRDALLLPVLRSLGRSGHGPGSDPGTWLDRDRRLRTKPDRTGDRVRLLLRPRGAGVPQARLRG